MAYAIKGGEIMPRKNGTGPLGQGPMTGRAAGRCNPSFIKTEGLGRGLKRGIGRGFFNSINAIDSEKENLIQQKEWLDQQSAVILNRLAQIEEDQKKQG